jgi:hypothetical protein
MSPLRSCEDEAQLHHARAQRVVRGLEAARRHRLHDVEDHADEAEAVAEHLHAHRRADVAGLRQRQAR